MWSRLSLHRLHHLSWRRIRRFISLFGEFWIKIHQYSWRMCSEYLVPSRVSFKTVNLTWTVMPGSPPSQLKALVCETCWIFHQSKGNLNTSFKISPFKNWCSIRNLSKTKRIVKRISWVNRTQSMYPKSNLRFHLAGTLIREFLLAFLQRSGLASRAVNLAHECNRVFQLMCLYICRSK